MQAFDQFIIVDWSARAKPSPRKPSKDSIWIGEGTARGRVTTKYFRTRHAASEYLLGRFKSLAKRKKRVLVGWDFAFGYPKGLVKALRLNKKQPWLSVWKLLDRLIVDKRNNHNNRFSVGGDLNRRITGGSGPFWGVPVGQSGVFLGQKKDFSYPVTNKRVSLPERRLVERRVKKMQPPWKLAYTGSVGGQSLLGIPRLYDLVFREDKLSGISQVWPFETNFGNEIKQQGALLLHAEIYPSHLPLPGKDKILDREQVKTYVKWLQHEQAKGRLEKWLDGPTDLDRSERKVAIRHEGWVLGVK